MWPKMLFELLPHVGRVIPMAERFFATRGAREQEEQAALARLAETVQTELGKVTDAHAAMERALGEQGKQVSAAVAEVTRVRLGVESVQARLEKLESGFGAAAEAAVRAEKATTRVAGLFVVAVVLLILVVIGVAVVVVRVWAR